LILTRARPSPARPNCATNRPVNRSKTRKDVQGDAAPLSRTETAALRRLRGDQYDNLTVIGRKTQRLFHQIADGAPKEQGIGVDFTLACARDETCLSSATVSIIGRHLVDGRAGIESGRLNVTVGRFRPGQEKAGCRSG